MQYFGYQDLVPELRKFGAPILQSVENFLAAKQEGSPAERKDKACGSDGAAVVCQMQIDLRMRHYQLTPNMDPILIYQQFDDFLWLNTVARHQDIFQGRERQWCYSWRNAIYWDGNEHHLEELEVEFENA